MLKLDADWLESVGLRYLPATIKSDFLSVVYEEIERRVGMELSSVLTDSELGEFENLIVKDEDDASLRWLETNLPNYQEVVDEQAAKVADEIRTAAPRLLAAEGVHPVDALLRA